MKAFPLIGTFLLATAILAGCSSPQPRRPHILGVSHVAFFASDYENTCKLYSDFFGYARIHTSREKDGSEIEAVFQINDRQHVAIVHYDRMFYPRMSHFALETDDVEAMLRYLKAQYKMYVQDTIFEDGMGNRSIFVTDPNGVMCRFVQYNRWTILKRKARKYLPDSRISTCMRHVGIQCPDLDKAMAFYGDILGFKEVWRGGADPAKVSWVHLQVPDGDQTIELMLYDKEPTPKSMGSMNHICLEVEDIPAAKAILDTRPYPETCGEPSGPRTGIIKKLLINYYDPDGSRIELMSRETVDGIPAEPSKGVPMKYGKRVGETSYSGES